MTYIVLFEDNPTADPKIRRPYMKAHLSFLRDHAGQVLAAGPLHDDLGVSAGGRWIVQVGRCSHGEEFGSARPVLAHGPEGQLSDLAVDPGVWSKRDRDLDHLLDTCSVRSGVSE